MREIYGKAYAKINLTLDIEGLRDDGYHIVRTVMQQISLCDNLRLREREHRKMRVRFFSNLPYLPGDDRNNAVIAAKRFYQAAGITGVSLDINARKRIPVAGGLGGSSTDAACVLRLLSRLHPNALTEEKIYEIAASIGADVPFFLKGGCVLAQGIGDKLTKLCSMPSAHIIVAKNSRGLSAGKIYKAFDEGEKNEVPTTDKMLTALEKRDLFEICGAVSNMLMTPAGLSDSTVYELRSAMQECGAMAACMSGSGSSVYGIFDSEEKVSACKKFIKDAYPSAEVFITRPIFD